MELTLDIEYEQVLKLVRQLPYRYKKKLDLEIRKDLEQINTVRKKQSDSNGKFNEFQRFVLDGPVMADEQYEDFKGLRKDFNRWLEK
jgi:hypothetical protein